MKYTAIKRMDKLGRLLLPREIRRSSGFTIDTELIIEAENGEVLIKAYRPVCKLCGSDENVDKELLLCGNCLEKLKN